MLTAHWGERHDERQLIIRRVAGALSRRARVSVIHLAGPGARERWERDGAFEVQHIAVQSGSPQLRSLLIASLGPGVAARGLPRVADAQLEALQGGAPAGLVSAVLHSRPDVLVIGGLVPSPAEGWPAGLGQVARIAVLPLSGDEPLLELPGYREALGIADVVCTFGPGEARRLEPLRASAGTPVVERLSVPFPVDRVAAAFGLRGPGALRDHVVFLRGFGPAPAVPVGRPGYEGLERLVPGLVVADVTHEAWTIRADGGEQVVPAPPSRPNLWRLMFGALATVDLRPGGLLARELIESLLLGTPVAVPAGGRSEGLMEESGGGLVFAGEAELGAALRTFADPQARSALAERGRRWAEEHHGDQERFTGAVVEAVLGLPHT